MRRRALLSLAATGLVAGCAGAGDGPTGDDTETTTATTADATTETSTPAPRLTDAAFTRRQECPDPGAASVRFEQDPRVLVTGCIRGANGCTVPELADAVYDADAGVLTVTVATREEGGTDRACTQAIVELGYRVTVSFADALPGVVAVVHDGVDGRREVARVTR